mgnify:CR=1 FL=1
MNRFSRAFDACSRPIELGMAPGLTKISHLDLWSNMLLKYADESTSILLNRILYSFFCLIHGILGIIFVSSPLLCTMLCRAPSPYN